MAIDTQRHDKLIENRQKLDDANVLVIGCGAVGSVTAPILQRLGVNKFTLIDGDDVEDHNLNRQLFSKQHVGKNKALAIAQQMRAVDPDVKLQVIPNYVHIDELTKMLATHSHIIFAADTLYLEGLVYAKLKEMDAATRPVFISPRMSGYLVELYTWMPRGPEPNGIYFSSTPDKDYSAGASCTGAHVPEPKIAQIATTTNILCGLAAQAFVHSVEGLPFQGKVQLDLLKQLGGTSLPSAA